MLRGRKQGKETEMMVGGSVQCLVSDHGRPARGKHTGVETYRSGGANLANPRRKRIPGRVVAGAKALGQELLWNAEKRAGEASLAGAAGRQELRVAVEREAVWVLF